VNIKLLEKVCEAIKAEPKRFHMNVWATNDVYYDIGLPDRQVAPCGTAACIGGFAVILTKTKGKTDRETWVKAVSGVDTGPRTEILATDLLDLDVHQAARLFHDHDWPYKFREAWAKARTPAQRVRVAISRIKHFIKTEGRE